ncbi:hypothetical protein V6C27_11525 [Peptococcaceae bacterium 1198_IL3148]
MKKNNRKLRKLVGAINFKASEAAKLNQGSIVGIDIANMGLKGKYYKHAKRQIRQQGIWSFSYIRGGTKLMLKAQN